MTIHTLNWINFRPGWFLRCVTFPTAVTRFLRLSFLVAIVGGCIDYRVGFEAFSSCLRPLSFRFVLFLLYFPFSLLFPRTSRVRSMSLNPTVSKLMFETVL